MTRTYVFDDLGGPEVLRLVNEQIAEPGRGEVQVEMKAAGLNRAELLFLQGQYLVQPNLPNASVGMEGAGIVRAVGDNVEGVSVGDRVAVTPALAPETYGVLGEIINAPAIAIEPIPENVSFRDAAAFWMAFGTAYGMTHISGGLREGAGQSVVITAASSSVGTAAFQVVRRHGGVSIATTRMPAKKERLLEAGADHVIVTEDEDLVDRIMEITDGKGFDLACDPVCGPMLAPLAAAAGREARIVEMGFLSGETPELPFFEMIGKGLVITAFHLSWQMLHVPERRAIAAAHLNQNLSDGSYTPKIDMTFSFDRVADAYAYLAGNEQVGKIIVEFD